MFGIIFIILYTEYMDDIMSPDNHKSKSIDTVLYLLTLKKK